MIYCRKHAVEISFTYLMNELLPIYSELFCLEVYLNRTIWSLCGKNYTAGCHFVVAEIPKAQQGLQVLRLEDG